MEKEKEGRKEGTGGKEKGRGKWYWWGKEQSGICREDVGGTYAGH